MLDKDESLTSQYTIIFALWILVFSASSQIMIVVAMLPVIGEQLSIIFPGVPDSVGQNLATCLFESHK